MALFRGVRSTTSLFTCLRTPSVENFYRIHSSLFASSSDEEPQRPQLPVKPIADTDDPKARAEYRTWVENMLTGKIDILSHKHTGEWQDQSSEFISVGLQRCRPKQRVSQTPRKQIRRQQTRSLQRTQPLEK